MGKWEEGSVEERLSAVLCEVLSCDEEEIEPDTTLEDLGADEIDLPEIAIAIAQDFDFGNEPEPDEDYFTAKTTFARLAAIIQEKTE